MAEYVERTAALEITTRTCGDYAAAWSEIRKLPAADVAPVIHSYWEAYSCSQFMGTEWTVLNEGIQESVDDTRKLFCQNRRSKIGKDGSAQKRRVCH